MWNPILISILTYRDLASRNLFVGLSEWQLPVEDISPSTAVKYRSFGYRYQGNQVVQMTHIKRKFVTSVFFLDFCCYENLAF